jgi:dethiobiotin synthetase
VAERTNPDALAELCRTAVLGVVPRTPEIHSAEGAATAVAAGLNPDAVLDAIASGAAVRR